MGPFFGQGEQGSWFELGSREDGFQRNLNVDRFTMDRIPAISGAKHLYRSAFAQLRGDHHRFDASGAVDTVASSAAGRLLVTPNAYETAPEFNARLVDELDNLWRSPLSWREGITDSKQSLSTFYPGEPGSFISIPIPKRIITS